MKIEIFHDLTKGAACPDHVVDIGDQIPCLVKLVDVGASDPLNQLRKLSFKCGNSGASIIWDVNLKLPIEIANIENAMRALLIYAIDNAAELRDHLRVAR